MLKNDRFLRALARQPVDYTPLWIMRQAGRYLPEYRASRARAGDFLTLCKTPELACEVTLQPVRRFDLDAAIIFSDILTIPDAMGLGLHFVEGEGPRFSHPVQTPEMITKLHVPHAETELAYVMDAIKLVKQGLENRIPLLGFAGSPWTIAVYMLEGGASKNFAKIKKWLYAHPADLHQLLYKLALAVGDYLCAQITAGVDAVMLFDTWGGILTPQTYRDFSLYYMELIVNHVRQHAVRATPVILFTKNGGQWLEAIAATGCDGIGVDWTTDLADARQRVQNKVALQGNLDPAVLYAPAAESGFPDPV